MKEIKADFVAANITSERDLRRTISLSVQCMPNCVSERELKKFKRKMA